jgi:hypothetical protein
MNNAGRSRNWTYYWRCAISKSRLESAILVFVHLSIDLLRDHYPVSLFGTLQAY